MYIKLVLIYIKRGMLHILATNINSHRTGPLSERQGVIKHSHRLTGGQTEITRLLLIY